jgi:hypothetical protein
MIFVSLRETNSSFAKSLHKIDFVLQLNWTVTYSFRLAPDLNHTAVILILQLLVIRISQFYLIRVVVLLMWVLMG